MQRNHRSSSNSFSAPDCQAVLAVEWAYVDGSLPSQEHAAVQAHLDNCSACRAEIDHCRSLESVLQTAVKAVPSPGDLRSGFYSRLARDRASSRRKLWAAALPAFAIGLLTIGLIRHGNHGLPASNGPKTTIAGSTAAVPYSTSRTEIASLAPDRSPHVEQRIVPGLSNGQAERLLTRAVVARTPIHSAARHRRSDPRGEQIALGSARHFLSQILPSTAESLRKRDLTSSMSLAEAEDKRDSPTLSLKISALFPKQTQRAELTAQSALDFQNTTLASAGPIQPATGVSLQVDDEVRGFTNSTRIVAGVDAQDSEGTFHIEADGN